MRSMFDKYPHRSLRCASKTDAAMTERLINVHLTTNAFISDVNGRSMKDALQAPFGAKNVIWRNCRNDAE